MRRYVIRIIRNIGEAFRKGDLLLLLLCLVTTGFGCLIIASATNYTGSLNQLITQIAAALLGVMMYILVSSVDVEWMSEHRTALVIFNVLFLCLLIPFGTDNGTGNRSWLDLPLIPFYVQPAEICKITFIVILASVMASHQNKISGLPAVIHMVVHLGIPVVLNMALSKDAGVSLIFVFIFIGMAFAGGVSLFWFLIAAGGGVVAAPVLWNFMSEYQQNRILVLFDETIDPTGIEERWHMKESLRSITGGGMLGQGLFNGHRTQNGDLNAQHTDFIFSAIGEELGYLGCALTLLLLVVIIARCIWVGNRSQDYMRRLICFGAASALSFQVISNVGMCIGVTPVIGLTLPFISYGGSSIVSLYAMLGLVSGVHARPNATSHERYIRPPIKDLR